MFDKFLLYMLSFLKAGQKFIQKWRTEYNFEKEDEVGGASLAWSRCSHGRMSISGMGIRY